MDGYKQSKFIKSNDKLTIIKILVSVSSTLK